MIKPLRLLGLVAVIVATFIGSKIAAQVRPSSPAAPKSSAAPAASLTETLDWIRDRLLADGPSGTTYKPINFSTCTISWLQVDEPLMDTHTVPLQDIDASAVEVKKVNDIFIVHFETKDKKKSIKDEAQVPPMTLMQTGTSFVFRTLDIADRVAKAVRHAATLCAKQPF